MPLSTSAKFRGVYVGISNLGNLGQKPIGRGGGFVMGRGLCARGQHVDLEINVGISLPGGGGT